jgi:transcriptional regulator with XRE-family HTH domain
VISKLTGRQLRAGRGLLGWTAQDLADASGVGVATIRRAEAGDGQVRMIPANTAALIRTMAEKGVDFIEENGGGAGVRMKVPGT